MKFSVVLSEFQFITLRSGARRLRFTLTWELRHGDRVYGDKQYGCVARRLDDGTLVWSPHMTTYRRNLRRVHEVTPDFYAFVLDSLERSPFVRFLDDPLWTPPGKIEEASGADSGEECAE